MRTGASVLAPSPKGSEKTLLRGGVEAYRWFYENSLLPLIEKYREGELSKEDASSAIALSCVDRNSYRVFHVVDVWEEGKAIDRRLFRTGRTFQKLLSDAKERRRALLYRGVFVIPKEVWKEYKENYREADRFRIFKLDRLVRLAPYILMDLDAKDGVKEDDVKRLVSYLHKLGVFPEVWRSPSGGFHVYIHLIGRVEKITERDPETEEKVGEKIEHYLPYASDFRLELIIKALKDVCNRLNIPYDSISCDRAVWLEGIENPEKGGKKSEKVFEGAVHRLDKLFEKLRPLWERELREKAWIKFEREVLRGWEKRKKKEEKGSVEIREVEHSNPIDYLQENVSFAFRMLDRGYTWAEIEGELRAGWKGDEKAFDRAFSGFRDFVERVYRPLPKKEMMKAEEGEKKHKHYWEYVPILHEALRQEKNLSIRELSRKTGIPKSSLADIFKLVSREQVLNSPEEAVALLKQYQKGGDRLSEDAKKRCQERGREKWLGYLKETLKKSLSPKGKKGVEVQDEGLPPIKEVSVRIGHKSITPEGIRREEGGEISPSPEGKKRKNRVRIVDEVSRLLSLLNLPDDERETLKKSLFRLLFGAWRRSLVGEKNFYDLSRFVGYGEEFIELLSNVLKTLGHQVVVHEDPKKDHEDLPRKEGVKDLGKGYEDLGKDHVKEEGLEPDTNLKEVDIDLNEVIFADKNVAIAYLESLNGKYALGDRVRLWVVALNGEVALYEFEKVLKRKYRGLADTSGYEVETWELKKIHWDLEDRNGEDSGGERVSSGEDSGGRKEERGRVQDRDKGGGKRWGSSDKSDIQAPRKGTSEIHEGAEGEKGLQLLVDFLLISIYIYFHEQVIANRGGEQTTRRIG